MPIDYDEIFKAIEEMFAGVQSSISEFFAGIRGDRSYLMILNNIARSYKSQMALALNGLW